MDPPRPHVSFPLTTQWATDTLHRSIVLADIEGYSQAHRTDFIRGILRKTLYQLLDEAIRGLGIPGNQHESVDQGDGVLVFFHPNVPKSRLLSLLIPGLTKGLMNYNATATMQEQVRLRVVVHAGELLGDEHGYYGEVLNEAFALMDSGFLRSCLAETTNPLVLLVTDPIYQGIVRHGLDGITPTSYQHVRVSVKGRTKMRAWLQIAP